MFPLHSITSVGGHLSIISAFFHGPSFQRAISRRLRHVNSVRHVVSGITINEISPERIIRLGCTLNTLGPVGTTYLAGSGTRVRSVNSRVGLYRTLCRHVSHRLRRSPPRLITGNNIVTTNFSPRLSRLHSVSHNNHSCLLGVRRRRTRGANVRSLGINCGGIFNCCLRIHGACGSRIPRR